MEERLHVLKVLQEVESALVKKKYIKIKQLSDNIIHTASIHQDPYVEIYRRKNSISHHNIC